MVALDKQIMPSLFLSFSFPILLSFSSHSIVSMHVYFYLFFLGALCFLVLEGYFSFPAFDTLD